MFNYFFYFILNGGDNLFFDDFVNTQGNCYYLLRNSLLKGKLSHAYLIDGNNNDNSYDFVFAFIKMIICPHHYSCYSLDKCFNCNLCHRIQNLNYPEISIIESDSSVIKKEQLLELQSDFSTLSVEGTYRIYVIKDCDKMNKYACNALLKFLEEPADNIIAILVTNHFSKILSTVVSRCQVVHLNNVISLENNSSIENFAAVYCNSSESFSLFLQNESNANILRCVIDFILYSEDNGVDTIIYMKKLWYNVIKTREENLLAFTMIIYFYYDVLKSKYEDCDYLFCENIDIINKISDLNSVDFIINKLNVFQYAYDMILNNLNINLLLDDIVIRLGEVK